MSRGNMPVVAAIPNYNMGDSLGELLPQLVRQDYAEIFVLDDASADQSREITESVDDERITFVSAAENVGAGANRNKIIDVLGYNAIIHFVDADMVIETPDAPSVANEVAGSRSLGFVGGLIKEANGLQMPFNYGPRFSFWSYLTAKMQHQICSHIENEPEKAAKLRRQLFAFVQDFPDPQAEPVPRQIFWNAEGNLLIRADTFEVVGGFDTNLRYHEIQDLALKLRFKGLENRFEPELSGMHKAIQVRKESCRRQRWTAEGQLMRKYGLRNWLLPDHKLRPPL